MKPRRLRTAIHARLRRATAGACGADIHWRPLVLCWQRRMPRAQSRGGPSSTVIHQHSHSQAHLHLTLHTSVAATRPRASTPRVRAPNAPKDIRVFTRIEPQRTIHRPELRTTHERLRIRSFSTTQRETLRTAEHASAAPTISPRANAASLTIAQRRFVAPRSETTPPLRNRAVTVASTATLTNYSRRDTTRAVHAASVETVRAPAIASPLVWRKPASPATAVNESTVPAAADVTHIAAAMPTTTRLAAPAVPVLSAQVAREALRMNLFDPAVADRLADDVLRRVDKRLRIERERRGL